MTKKRLNDTRAVKAMPAPSGMGDSEFSNIEIRKISNGYLRTERTSSPDGGYEFKETYHETKPMLLGEPVKSPPSNLDKAIKAMK